MPPFRRSAERSRCALVGIPIIFISESEKCSVQPGPSVHGGQDHKRMAKIEEEEVTAEVEEARNHYTHVQAAALAAADALSAADKVAVKTAALAATRADAAPCTCTCTIA